MTIHAKISGVGHYVPPRVLTNKDLEKIVETSDEWIQSRTGIRERRILEDGKGSSYMGALAAKLALENAEISPQEIELIVVATVTPDMFFPSTACLVQEEIGAKNAWGVDVNGACTGFLYATAMAAQFIESGRYRKVLVVGSDKMSAITDYTDRNTCILFGDAAGAIVLEPTENPQEGIMDFLLKSDGSGQNFLYMKGGGSLHPATHETVDNKMHYIYQDGRTVFKFAVTGMADITEEIVRKNNIDPQDIKLFIPHQANLRIIDATAKRLKLPDEKVLINIHRYGNTTAATIPLGLSEAYYDGRIQQGDILVFAAFGAGFTWGSILLRWAY
ncbi:MAG: ketoacyl-ACP synthase III [Calditrichaeota bacterium]|nr:MAG: ketoacyl-ACP synthase III [Calditrichota bacterium]